MLNNVSFLQVLVFVVGWWIGHCGFLYSHSSFNRHTHTCRWSKVVPVVKLTCVSSGPSNMPRGKHGDAPELLLLPAGSEERSCAPLGPSFAQLPRAKQRRQPASYCRCCCLHNSTTCSISCRGGRHLYKLVPSSTSDAFSFPLCDAAALLHTRSGANSSYLLPCIAFLSCPCWLPAALAVLLLPCYSLTR